MNHRLVQVLHPQRTLVFLLGDKIMNTQSKELSNFWNELKDKSVIQFKDIDKLQGLIEKVFLKMQELESSKNKWKEKALRK